MDAFYVAWFWKELILVAVDLCVTLLHDLDYLQDLLHVFPGSDQALQHQHLIVDEHVSIQTPHHLKEAD